MRGTQKKGPTGIRARHARSCAGAENRCTCSPSWEASVFSKRDGRKIRRTFRTLAEARTWRAEATIAVGQGRHRAPTATTFREAAAAWLDGSRRGEIQTRSGRSYKPAAVRSYETSLERHVLGDLGPVKLAALRRADVQALVDRMRAEDLSPSTIRNTINAVRAVSASPPAV